MCYGKCVSCCTGYVSIKDKGHVKCVISTGHVPIKDKGIVIFLMDVFFAIHCMYPLRT